MDTNYKKTLFLCILSAVLATAASNAIATDFWGKLSGNNKVETFHQQKPLQNRVTGTVPSLAPVIKKIVPSVVNISTTTQVTINAPAINPLMQDPFFRQFFNFNVPQMQQQQQKAKTTSVGSGVVVDSAKGYILTNNHVVKGADEIFVTLTDNRKLKASLVGADEETDLAVLKIEAKNLYQINFGSSSNLEVGDYVIAVGNPFGLGQTVTHGIVSAIGRNGLGIEGYEDFIQTDAPINPGNSGGALVDLNGNLVGINTAILSKSGGSVGIGFAIPVDLVKNITKQISAGKTIERGQLGINIQDLTPELANGLGSKATSGALVANVKSGSAGEAAGLKSGDIIIKFNNQVVEGSADLKNKVAISEIGQEVELTIIRDGVEKTVAAKIGKKTAAQTAASAEIEKLKGATFSDMPDNSKIQGVIVKEVEPNSKAANAGLEQGDVIVSINKKKITSIKDLPEAAKLNRNTLLINLLRGDMAMYIVVQ